MGDILKEALAEAKLVKKVAIETAKAQLNEALTPKIESMLSKKIKEELEDDEMTDDEELDETEDPGKGDQFNDFDKKDQDVTPALSETEDPGSVTDKQEKDDQDVTPDLKEEEEMSDSDEEDLEIESILRELEDEEEHPEPDADEMGGEGDGDEDDVDINIEPEADDEENLGEEELPGLEDEPVEDETDDEDINVEEILNSIDEEEYPGDDSDENKDSEQQNVVKTLENKVVGLQKELREYKKAVKFLKGELSEVNLLNNKLFLTTKLLKKFNVSNKTKMNIIETFDRAKNVREVKLIYTTLFESLRSGNTSNSSKKINSLKEIKQKTNSSSKTVIVENYNPDPTILAEGDDLRNRFAKLANIRK